MTRVALSRDELKILERQSGADQMGEVGLWSGRRSCESAMMTCIRAGADHWILILDFGFWILAESQSWAPWRAWLPRGCFQGTCTSEYEYSEGAARIDRHYYYRHYRLVRLDRIGVSVARVDTYRGKVARGRY